MDLTSFFSSHRRIHASNSLGSWDGRMTTWIGGSNGRLGAEAAEIFFVPKVSARYECGEMADLRQD